MDHEPGVPAGGVGPHDVEELLGSAGAGPRRSGDDRNLGRPDGPAGPPTPREDADLPLEELALAGARRGPTAALPVPVLTTDRSGTVQGANAAAAATLGVSVLRLLGKPFGAFLSSSSRTAVQSLLAEVGDEPQHLPGTVRPRGRPPLDVALVAVGERGTVRWTVLPEATGPGRLDAPRTVPLLDAFASLSALGSGEGLSHELLTRVAGCALAGLPGATAVSVEIGHPDDPRLMAVTGPVAAELDGLQMQAGDGPCALAYENRETVTSDRLADDARWVRFAARLAGRPASAVAVPLERDGELVGVLNVYADADHAFDDRSVHLAELVAMVVGSVLSSLHRHQELRRLADQLADALRSRAVIDQAKGIVMAHRRCTADEAFAHLAQLSQHRNVKVRDVARALVDRTSSGVDPAARPAAATDGPADGGPRG